MKFNLYDDVCVCLCVVCPSRPVPSVRRTRQQTLNKQTNFNIYWNDEFFFLLFFLTNITQNGKEKKKKELIQFDKTTSI